jgi:DNA topoisomerase-1
MTARTKKSKPLIIVESNAKVRTISRYLGGEYDVFSCRGHIRDLPKSKLGVEIENGFVPTYNITKGQEELVEELRKSWESAEKVLLACDPDREGEAICWHLMETMGDRPGIERITFNEITEPAIKSAVLAPRKVNMDVVNAQQARRILDRLVGYKISPLLWPIVRAGLSAGRVQTVALRLVVEREKEISAFVPVEYWTIGAVLKNKEGKEFPVALFSVDGKKIVTPLDKKTAKTMLISSKKEAEKLVSRFSSGKFTVKEITQRDAKRSPSPPFITSTLQQAASRMLGYTPKKTMLLAQRLYEGKDLGSGERTGLITYMRTDSVRVAEGAVQSCRELIEKKYGAKYLPQGVRYYKNPKASQDAHEAVRPTDVSRTPESLKNFLENDEYRLYNIIWRRFVASQMSDAITKQTTVTIEADGGLFRANGHQLVFPGFYKVWFHGEEDVVLPELAEGEELTCKKLTPKQHFTEPPARYNDATLVRTLEENGVGRPSTYAPIISTLLDRGYVERLPVGRSLKPTEIGELTADVLVRTFDDIFEVEFTAGMETKLDQIEEGAQDWVKVLRDFYRNFDRQLQGADQRMYKAKKANESDTEIKCELCGKPMRLQFGRSGRFLGCTGYPECPNTKPVVFDEDGKPRPMVLEEKVVCDKCGKDMVMKSGRFGLFLACSGYPDCKNTKSYNIDLGIACPKPGCGGKVVQLKSRKGRIFFGCSKYPKCDFATWYRPVDKPCPKCKATFLVEKGRGKNKKLVCLTENCDYQESPEGEDE